METETNPANHQLDVFFALLASLLICFSMLGLGVYALQTYGMILFIATPLVASCASAFCYNFRQRRTLGKTMLVSIIGLMLPMLLMLLWGLEGLICVLMALPFAIAIGCLGSVMGYAASERLGIQSSQMAIAILLLPLLAGVETATVTSPLTEVVTTMEINAPPEAVWPHMIAYSSLPEPDDVLFRAGIGYPQNVWMEGTGVGSTRYCGFSTGTYVEPITCWAPPYRLTFDVTNTPPAMKEMSFYEHVNAPHLEQTPRNRKGEFRLVRLPGNRTRLEGSTWYDIDMYPQFYWQ